MKDGQRLGFGSEARNYFPLEGHQYRNNSCKKHIHYCWSVWAEGMVTMKLLCTINDLKNENQPNEKWGRIFQNPYHDSDTPLEERHFSFLLCLFSRWTDKQIKITKDTLAESLQANAKPKLWCCCRNKIDSNLCYCKNLSK